MGSTISPKVVAATLAAAVATILVWGISQAGVDVPEPVAGAIVVVLTFLAGYLKIDPERA